MAALNPNKQTCIGKEADVSPQTKQTNLYRCGSEEVALTLAKKFGTKFVINRQKDKQTNGQRLSHVKNTLEKFHCMGRHTHELLFTIVFLQMTAKYQPCVVNYQSGQIRGEVHQREKKEKVEIWIILCANNPEIIVVQIYLQ